MSTQGGRGSGKSDWEGDSGSRERMDIGASRFWHGEFSQSRGEQFIGVDFGGVNYDGTAKGTRRGSIVSDVSSMFRRNQTLAGGIRYRAVSLVFSTAKAAFQQTPN